MAKLVQVPETWFFVLLFPGVIFHELSHFIACKVLGVKVRGVKLWGLNSAHVRHDVSHFTKNILIAMAPLILGSLAAIIFTALGHMAVKALVSVYNTDIIRVLLFYWLGLSFAYHCFPSKTDADNGIHSLTTHYKSRLAFKAGIVKGLLYWISVPPFFVPLYLLLRFARHVSVLPQLGLAWFILIFLFSAVYFGV